MTNGQQLWGRKAHDWRVSNMTGELKNSSRDRELAPTLPLLIPGVGAQGGDVMATVKAGLRTDATGAITGTIVVENVFVLPGIGRLVFQAISNRDLIVVRDVVMLLAAVVVVVPVLSALLRGPHASRIRTTLSVLIALAGAAWAIERLAAML